MPPGTGSGLSRRNIQRVFGSPFIDGNKVTLLWKNPELFHTIFSFLEKAEQFICLQFYIFRNDETGTELAEILKKKASEGVRVCLLYDHFGSMSTPWRFWKEMKKAGIEVRASRPFKWARPFHYVYRDHRKLIIIDGTIAFTGGLNIANTGDITASSARRDGGTPASSSKARLLGHCLRPSERAGRSGRERPSDRRPGRRHYQGSACPPSPSLQAPPGRGGG